jgi:hypothetical protein
MEHCGQQTFNAAGRSLANQCAHFRSAIPLSRYCSHGAIHSKLTARLHALNVKCNQTIIRKTFQYAETFLFSAAARFICVAHHTERVLAELS